MKHGYTCQCGWTLKRNDLTRREYAMKKAHHAEDCRPAANELRQSRGMQRLEESAEKPFTFGS